MHTANRPCLQGGCHRLHRTLLARVERAHRRKTALPPCATATLEAPPAQRRSTPAPSRAVVIGGSVAGLLSAAAASPFFDEASGPAPCGSLLYHALHRGMRVPTSLTGPVFLLITPNGFAALWYCRAPSSQSIVASAIMGLPDLWSGNSASLDSRLLTFAVTHCHGKEILQGRDWSVQRTVESPADHACRAMA